MNRLLIALIGAALVVGAFGLAQLQPVSAQPGGASICLSLPAGEHTFTAPSQDRAGDVSFTVTVGEGGVVTGFTEPGGQSIPPAAMLDIFAGEDAYPLPEGVSFIECDAGGGELETAAASANVCVNLGPGSHTGTTTAGGQSYDLTIHVGNGGVLRHVDILGQSYSAQDAVDLLQGFGATLPPGVEIVPCATAADATPTLYGNLGTGGLADRGGAGGLWSAIAIVGVLFAVGAAAAVRRRRADVSIRG